MKPLDKIINEICQKEGKQAVYKEVFFDSSLKYEFFHEDRVKLKNGSLDFMEGCGLTLIHRKRTSFQDGYKLKQPVCTLCGSETFLNTETEEYYCPVHYK